MVSRQQILNIFRYWTFQDVVRKVHYRFTYRGERRDSDIDFLRSIQVNPGTVLANDPVWNEALSLERELGDVWSQHTHTKQYKGEANVALLYYLTRLVKPEYIVETGVASGFSTAALLSASERNGLGQLYSSELPYLEVHNATVEIGPVIDQKLRHRWHLYLGSDRRNLPTIVRVVPRIDLFHYDSDKSYAGRQYAMRIIEKRLHKDSILIFDDAGDNNFFKDFSRRPGLACLTLKHGSKYVGVASMNNEVLHYLSTNKG